MKKIPKTIARTYKPTPAKVAMIRQSKKISAKLQHRAAAHPAATRHHDKPAPQQHLLPTSSDLGIYNPQPFVAVAGKTTDVRLRANAPAKKWKATGLPEGLVINPINGNISGTAKVLGSYDVVLSCENDTGKATLEILISVE